MILFLLLLLVVLGGAFYAYYVAFYSPKSKRNLPPRFDRKSYAPYKAEMEKAYQQLREREQEPVTVLSRDGLQLRGHYYHVSDGAPLDIGFHGYRSSAYLDFCGGACLSFEMGHNLLLVDERAHGDSEGYSITFGIREREDVLCWVDYARERFGPNVKILLYGVSMGASTVLMASGLTLPDNVRGIVADSPYNSPLEIIRKVARQMGKPDWLIRPLVLLGARIYGGFDLQECDPEQAVKHSTVPILLIHGEADGFVPCQMSESIFQANPEKVTRLTFQGADHGLSYLADTPRYRQAVFSFCESVLK